ncbi:MAG TPA: glycosyl transferase, partial [Ornithinibacter sp.]|nr:glycosyl transferase [Ornithinibacter sp.]
MPSADDGFGSQVRGYRRAQVDEVVRILEDRVAAHDRAIAHLRGEEPPPPPPAPRPATKPAPAPASATHADPDAAHPASAEPPMPWRRSDLVAPAAYVLIAAWLLWGLIADLRTGHLSQGVQDQQAFEWYFGATAHNLVTLSNPLFTDLQNFPDGVNLMANASVLGLGIPLAPLTLLAGPSATFVLVEVLGLALTASAWFWLFRRRLAVHPLLAAIGAGFAGFAPGMISHANGHPNFVAQFLVPLIVDRVIRIAEGARPRRDAVVLGLLAAWQVFIGEEVLLLTAVGLAIATPVLLVHHRDALRPLARGLAIGAAVCVPIVAVPLWWQFAGPRSYTSIWHPPGGNDLAQLWGRATRSLGADPWASAALSMNRTEENSFFGIPLLLAAVAVVIALWRRPVVQALGAVVFVTCWLSLGEEVVVRGTATGVPGPWAVLGHVPLLENVLPTRFALIAVPALGALLAIGAEEVRRAVSRRAGSAGAGLGAATAAAALVLLPVVPTPLVVEDRAPMPQFFVDGSWKDWVDEGGSVLAAPAPWVGDTRALEWQARARWGFPVVAGYFVGPDTTAERGGQYGA